MDTWPRNESACSSCVSAMQLNEPVASARFGATQLDKGELGEIGTPKVTSG